MALDDLNEQVKSFFTEINQTRRASETPLRPPPQVTSDKTVLQSSKGFEKFTPHSAAPLDAPGSTSSPSHPFHLQDASDGGGAKVRVFYGEVNGMIPDGMSSGDDPPYIISVADGDILYLTASWGTSGDVITSLSISVGGSVPSDDTAGDGTYYHSIGSVAVDSSGDTPVVSAADGTISSLSLVVCRDWFSNPAAYSGLWGSA